jgi:hypothetical protein
MKAVWLHGDGLEQLERTVRGRCYPSIVSATCLATSYLFTTRSTRTPILARPVEELWQATQSRSHGAVQAVRVAMQKLGFEALIASRSSAERDAVCAMVAARILAPRTKLATTRWWHTTTLAEERRARDG